MQTRWGDREARRRDIVRAGLALFDEDGLPALQMREVARGAGIALGTVYRYFPTKESLYAAMYAARLREFVGGIRQTLAGTDDFETVFVAVATSYRDMYVAFGRDLEVLSPISGSEPVDPELFDAAVGVWAALRGIVERAGARDPDLSMAALWSAVIGLAGQFTTVRHELHAYSWDDATRYTARLYVSGLAGERDG